MAGELSDTTESVLPSISVLLPSTQCERMSTNQTPRNVAWAAPTEFDGIPETLIINVCLFGLMVLLFSFLRKSAWNYGRIALVNRAKERWTTVLYGRRAAGLNSDDVSDAEDATINREDVGLFQWISQTLSMSDRQLLQRCGSDAVLYQKFQRYLITYMAISTLLCIVIVLPLNILRGSLEGPMSNFGRLTIDNLHPNSRVMLVHCVVGLVLLGLAVLFMKMFSRSLAEDTEEMISDTLMISRIPRDQCFRNLLMQHLQEGYPELSVYDIQFAYDVTKLINSDQARLEAEQSLMESIQLQQETGQPVLIIPYRCGQSCFRCFKSCGALEVDCVEYYTAEVARLEEQCDSEKLGSLQRTVGIAFVTFNSVSMASRFIEDFRKTYLSSHNAATSSLSRDLDVQSWDVTYAPSPGDILWENLSTSEAVCRARAICANICWFFILLFLTAPTVVLNQLAQLEISKHISGIIVHFLPSILLLICTLLLPVIIYLSDEYFIPHWTKSGRHLSVMKKTFAFLVLTVIILPSAGLAGGSLPEVPQHGQICVLENKTVHSYFKRCINAALELLRSTATGTEAQENRFHWSCIFVSSNNAFFVNYIISVTFIGLGLELLRIQDLFLTGVQVLFARSTVERSAVMKVTDNPFLYGRNYAKMLCTFTAVMAYSIPCPLITPFGLLYLVLKYYLDRYNIYYCNTPTKISREIHTTAMNYVVIAAVILQLVLLAFLIIRADELRDINIFAVVELCAVLVLLSVRGCCGVVHFQHPFDYKQMSREELDGTEESGTIHSRRPTQQFYVPAMLSDHKRALDGAGSEVSAQPTAAAAVPSSYGSI